MTSINPLALLDLKSISDFLWGWPLILTISAVALFLTLYLYGVQFRFFTKSWKLALAPQKPKAISSENSNEKNEEITVFQAFINSLGASIGNGSIAGIPMAIYLGGPGAIFWLIVMGLFLLSIRFAEVYLGTYYNNEESTSNKSDVGGPMTYLGKIPGKAFLPLTYAVLCFLYTLAAGNAVQCNSISVGVVKAWNIDPLYLGIGLTAFVVYVLLGGAQRIIDFSLKIVPLKVGFFFICSIIMLIYHAENILPAIELIIKSAFTKTAAISGTGYIMLAEALRNGTSFSINASEVGVGTASVIFGKTEKQNPNEKGILSMLTAFITTHIVGLLVGLTVIASGEWACGEKSTALTLKAYETVFSSYAKWIVTTYTIIFGLSVLISYAYIARQCWKFVTNNRLPLLASLIYAAATFWGTTGSVDSVWNTIMILLAGMLIINLYGVLYLSPMVRKDLKKYIEEESRSQ